MSSATPASPHRDPAGSEGSAGSARGSVTAPSTTDLIWQSAAEDLGPAKTFSRILDNARFMVTSVTVVAALLAGLGLVAANRIAESEWLRRLTIVTTVLAS